MALGIDWAVASHDHAPLGHVPSSQREDAVTRESRNLVMGVAMGPILGGISAIACGVRLLTW